MSTIVSYKKQHKIKIKITTKLFISLVQFGFFGLKVLQCCVLTPSQVENFRRLIVKQTKRTGKLFIRVFFNYPLTKKPLLTRMGKGVGPVKGWVSVVTKGSVVFELNGVSKKIAKLAFSKLSYCLPISFTIVSREIFCHK
jgi:large subunit ribosomal protein L16